MFLAPILIPRLSKSPEKIRNSSIVKKFPVRFWRLVNSCQTTAVCWGFGGNTIRILKEQFEEEYLHSENRPFKTATFSSFIRQLNLYGFRKVVRPVITNEHGQKLNTSLIEYKHPMFLKGHPELLPRIKRNTKPVKKEENGKTARSSLGKFILKRKSEDVQDEKTYIHQAKEQRTEIEGGPRFGVITSQPEKKGTSSSASVSVTTVSKCDDSTLTGPTDDPMQSQGTSQATEYSSPRFKSFSSNKPSITDPKDRTQTAKITKFPPLSTGISAEFCQSKDIASAHSGVQGQNGQQNNLTLNFSSKQVESCVVTQQPNKNKTTDVAGQAKPTTMEAVSDDFSDKQVSTESLSSKGATVAADGTLQTVTVMQRCHFPVKSSQELCIVGNGMKAFQDYSNKQKSQVQIPSAQEALKGIMFLGPVNGHSVLYLDQQSSFPQKLQPQATSQTSGVLKIRPPPVQIKSQHVESYSIPKTLSQMHNVTPDAVPLSATCEEVASHPLLQPVRKEYVRVPLGRREDMTGIQSCPVQFMNKQQFVSSSYVEPPTIPEAPLCSDQGSISADYPNQDFLSDLTLFKLSSSLKDIDASSPQEVVSSPQDLLESADVSQYRDEAQTLDVSLCNKQEQRSTGSTANFETNNNIEVQLIDCPKTKDVSSSGHTETPGNTELHTMTSTDISKTTCARRELFKEKVTSKITIPVSGLPKELFSSGITGPDKHGAVVTIETLEDGRVTGHLILPGKDSKKNTAIQDP